MQGYILVVTGHSLGAGAAALISLKLRDSFQGEHAADQPVSPMTTLINCPLMCPSLCCGPEVLGVQPARGPSQGT
jgi:acetyl esterase/lipase